MLHSLSSITLWFRVILISITIIITFQTHYTTCNETGITDAAEVPYFFVLGDPFKHAFEQDAILKAQGPQKYAFLNENSEEVEFERLDNNARTVNSNHANSLKDLKGSNTKQSFQNIQEDTNPKVFIFDTGNHTDRHGFIQVDRKKKNILPKEVTKKSVRKNSIKKRKQKHNPKNHSKDTNTKLVAYSNWSFGLKNGLKNSNRLINQLKLNKTKIRDYSRNSNDQMLNKDKATNISHQKAVQETTTHADNRLLQESLKHPKTRNVIKINEAPNDIKQHNRFVLFRKDDDTTTTARGEIQGKLILDFYMCMLYSVL